MTDELDERAREGGGNRRERPPEEGGGLAHERDSGRTDRYAGVDSGDAYARREVPGGARPARTPGATGPTTRNAAAAAEGRTTDAPAPEESDANEQLVGRARLGDAMKQPPKENNPAG